MCAGHVYFAELRFDYRSENNGNENIGGGASNADALRSWHVGKLQGWSILSYWRWENEIT